MTTAAQEFLRQAAEKSADLVHRQTIRKGIDSYDVAVAKGKARIKDWEAARLKCQQIKFEAVNNLDRYLEQFEAKVRARGGHVFWAETAEDARRYVCDLAVARGVKTVVKSKSMVTEEIHLAPAMEKLGMRVWETDLGEFIVQLRNEPPYHIVTPAMHLTRTQIAELFREKIGSDVTGDDPPELVAAARRALRRAFFSAEMGISGANFLVADVGMIAISTNEGNGRLTTSLPRIHVAVTGIEKIIPRLQDLAVLWPVLATAGTGQGITTYGTLIGGPRSGDEPDGPGEFHVVLLDNGRTNLLNDPEQREILHCIRCGACLNACPVFHKIGGHTYGTIYPGPIGSVLSPNIFGMEQYGHLPYASSLCGACTAICPVRIDLAHHLLHNRRNVMESHKPKWSEAFLFRVWRWAMMDAGRFRRLGWLARMVLRLINRLGLAGTVFDPMRPWTRYRAALDVPRRSFRELWREQNGQH
jgi:L-lactate dehydrogenase complex protein LldF